MVKVRIRFSVWLVSGYAHVFVLLFVAIVTLRSDVDIVAIECRGNNWESWIFVECNSMDHPMY